MTYTTDTSIAGPSRGSADAWYAWASDMGAARPDDVRDYLDTVYELAPEAGLRAELVVTQSIHETSVNGVPWASHWWRERCNPAGIGITGDPAQNARSRVFPDGRSAALAQLVHMALYVFGSLPPALAPYRGEDPRADAIPRDALGRRTTIGNFGSDGSVITWAVDPRYGEKWAGWANRLESVLDVDVPAGGTGGTGEEPPMVIPAGMKAHRFVGLDRDVLLPDDITVHIDIVPDRFIGWVRSGQRFTGQTKTTFHDTGSPGSRARSQRNYLHGGPSENGQMRQVGFNFAVDDREIWQLTPLDEVTWAAGTPEGNRTSWHVEQCFGPGIDWDRSLRNAIALHAGLCAAKGWSTDTALVQHRHWAGKWCPAQVLNRGLWPSVVSRVDAAAKAIAAGGVPVLPIAVGATVATTTRLNLRAEAGTDAEILTVLEAGTELVIAHGAVTTLDGYTWWQVDVGSPAPGWVAQASADGTVPYLVVTRPAPQPEQPEQPEEPGGWPYPAPLAIAQLAPIIGRPVVPMPAVIALDGGRVAIPTFDRVRTIRETRRLRDFDGAEDVGPVLPAGVEIDVSVMVVGDGRAHLITPMWTRIDAADVELVSDVPKEIQPAAPEAA